MPRFQGDVNTHLLFDDEQPYYVIPHTPIMPYGGQGANLYWELWIDLVGDGRFEGANDHIPLEDVILPITWNLGLDPYQQMARASSATIILDNSSGKYSPEGPDALTGFKTYRAIKLVSGGYPFAKTDGSGNFTGETEEDPTEQVMFMMRITDISPAPNQYSGNPVTVIGATDMLVEANDYPATMPMQINKYASEILEAAMKETGLYPPGTIYGWILGQSILGTDTILGNLTDPFNLDLGSYQYPYAMDNNEGDASLYDVIRYVVDTENGRFFINRAGQWEFWDRNHFLNHPNVDYVIDDDMIEMSYVWGSEVYNIVEVMYQPRLVVLTGTPTLVTHGSEISIPEDTSTTITLKFKDASGNPISSTSVIKPVGGVDYTVRDNYSAYDRTGLVSLVMNATASSVELTFTNNFHPIPGVDGDLTVNAGMTVRGNDSITAFDAISVRIQNDASVLEFGRRPYPQIPMLRFVDTYEQALVIANDILTKYAQPTGQAERIKIVVEDAASFTLALKGIIGDRIKLRETQTGHEREYFVIGERHDISDGGGSDYRLELTLEPA